MSSVRALLQRRPYWLSLLAGGLSATGFAPLDLWPVTLLCLALWMAVVLQADSRRTAALSGWLFGVGHFVVGLNWIARAFTYQSAMPEWLGYFAVVALSLYLAVYPALTALGAWWLGKKHPVALMLAFAGFWIFTEWLRSWVFSGFIWNPLGSVLLPLGQLPFLTKYVGSYGLSAIAVIAAAALLLAFRSQWKLALPTALVLAVPSVITKDSVFYTPGPPADRPDIIVVQPNIGQQDKWQAGYEAENLRKLASLTVREDDRPRLLFWPEAAIPDYLEDGYPRRYYRHRPEFVRQQLASLMKPGDMLLLGGLKLEFDEAGERAIGARNSVFAMDATGELTGRYDKNHLVPYGEYLPMRPVLTAIGLSRLVPGDFDFWPGPGPQTLDLGEFGKAGLQICYEIIFSGRVVDQSSRPDFIFNPSNDAWFGDWGPPQHLAQARLRAIEEGLPVIRSTPTGISAVINANGIVEHQVAMGVAGKIDAPLPSSARPTLFSRHGNILALGLALFLLICAIAIRRAGR
ncbi:apolipoprotein N-acyltransferase [Parasphingorhabdus marina]|uniref:apolipoprotein N-acyltransferase n=1 Tax=Parasphingorhabdus marina TaxID=394732 RepID=UPI000941A41E|nr:apolipoprotein N-acyltransferase [Parasphingorhabdus marina]